MTSMGARIKEIRKKLQLSQEAMGEILGSGKSYISAVENDKSKLSIESLVKLLVNHQVNINYILAGVGNPILAPKFEDVEDVMEAKVMAILKKQGVIE